MLPVFRHPVNQGQFILFERNGMRTYIRDSDSYGLVIEQRLPNGKKRRIQYGNDQAGYDLYIAVLRFLASTRQPIPAFRFESGRENALLKSAIANKIDEANRSNELVSHQMDMHSEGIIAPVRLSSGVQGLAISQDGQPAVFLSNELVRVISKVIPRIFKANPYFHQIHSFYSARSNRSKLQPMAFHSVPQNEEHAWTFRRWKPESKIAPSRIMGRFHRKLRNKH